MNDEPRSDSRPDARSAGGAADRYESRFRALFESTPLGILLYRFEADGGALRLEAGNAACDRLIHIEHASLMGLTIEEAFPGVVGTDFPERLREVGRTGTPFQTEQLDYRDEQIAGAFEVHAFRVESDLVAVLFDDVTRRRQQEQELEAYRTELERMVEERTAALVKAHAERDSVTGIAMRMVEARDPYTAGHQRRVAQLARELATILELGADEIDDIWVAAQLHDVGKVSVPSDILSKPGSLTPAEYALVQEHPVTSYRILGMAELGGRVADMVYQHHERLNGTGYPLGLSGDDILPGARILAVSDVVEAMVSHRPYRAARGVGAALGEIGRNSGVLYDEDVVNGCIALFARGFEFADQAT
jgi:HD-GYP domain-containing protein (c-di-GMP phosphodiesterase class II)